MNPITRSLDEVKYRIPRDILNQVFRKINLRWRETPISLDEQILSQVVTPRVLVDCNLVGGTETLISLEGLAGEMIEEFVTVYHIPKDRTQGRSIMSVLSINYGSMGMLGAASSMQAFKPCSVNVMLTASQAMMDAMSPIPVTSTARVSLIGENTVMVRNNTQPVGHSYLRAVLANDDRLSNIQMRSIPAFCKLVELAVKSYIYNEYVILMDRAQLSGGQDLGRFKEVIDGYADSEQMYQDYLIEKWGAIAFMNDSETFTRFIKMGIGSYR